MECIMCGKNEGRTPKSKVCDSCQVSLHRKKHPEKYKYFYGGNKSKAFIRDNFTCQVCGKNKNEVQIVIHHIDNNGKQRKGKFLKAKEQNNSLGNLITLCHSCHCKIHHIHREYKKYKNGKWSIKFDKCIICNSNKCKYVGKGMCSPCYERKRHKYKQNWYKKRKDLTLC